MAVKQVEISAGDTLQLTVKEAKRTKTTDTYVASKSVPGKQYHVYLYSDGTGACECKAYFERGAAADNRAYECSHIAEAKRPKYQTRVEVNPYRGYYGYGNPFGR